MINLSPTALRLVAGVDVAENLALEGMFLTGLSGDTFSVSGGGASASIGLKAGPSGGLFLKPYAKFGASNDHEIFGRFGYFSSRGNFSGSESWNGYSIKGSANHSDVAFGAGAKFGIAKDAHLTFDYMRYLEKDGVKIDGVTVGLAKSFN